MAQTGPDAANALREYANRRSTQTAKLVDAVLSHISTEIAGFDFSKKTRILDDLGEMAAIVQQSRICEPITGADYLELLTKSATKPPTRGHIICSSEEAITILEQGLPALPLLVPGRLHHGPMPLRSFDECLAYQEQFEVTNAHYWDKHVKGTEVGPETVLSSIVVQDILDNKRGRVNLLDLAPMPNVMVPPFICSTDASLLGLPNQRQQNTRAARCPSKDPSSRGAQFTIIGSTGSFSLPHIDGDGKATVLHCQEGSKLWFGWPPMDDAAKAEWGRSDGPVQPPSGAPWVIAQKKGDFLLLPPGYPHATYNAVNCACTGFFLLHSRSLNMSMEAILYQQEYPGVSNELVTDQMVTKLEAIEALWRSDSSKRGSYTFGDDAALLAFARGLCELQAKRALPSKSPNEPAQKPKPAALPPKAAESFESIKAKISALQSKSLKLDGARTTKPTASRGGLKPMSRDKLLTAVASRAGLTRCGCRTEEGAAGCGPKNCKCYKAGQQCTTACKRHQHDRDCCRTEGLREAQSVLDEAEKQFKADNHHLERVADRMEGSEDVVMTDVVKHVFTDSEDELTGGSYLDAEQLAQLAPILKEQLPEFHESGSALSDTE